MTEHIHFLQHAHGNLKNQNASLGFEPRPLRSRQLHSKTIPCPSGSALHVVCLCASVCLSLCPVTFILFLYLYLTHISIIHFRILSSVYDFVYVLLYMLCMCECVVCQESLNQLGHWDGNNNRPFVLFNQTMAVLFKYIVIFDNVK